MLAEFLRHFTAFRTFVKDTAKLGALGPNQWELSYIDAVPSGDLWKTPADWPAIFPGLFTPEQELQSLSTELMSADRVYEITPRRGRLHISANMAFVGGRAQPVLLVTTTARGPIEQDSDDELKAALDLGHDASVEAFTKMTSAAAKRHWGQLP